MISRLKVFTTCSWECFLTRCVFSEEILVVSVDIKRKIKASHSTGNLDSCLDIVSRYPIANLPKTLTTTLTQLRLNDKNVFSSI